MTLRGVANALLSSLFAPPCAACAQLLDIRWTAPSARAAGPIASGTSRSPLARPCAPAEPSPVDWAVRDRRYEGRLRDIIHALKYERRRSIAPPLGRLMRERGARPCSRCRRRWSPSRCIRAGSANAASTRPTISRGTWLARRATAAARAVHAPQVELPAAARHQNVRDAFALSGRLPEVASRFPTPGGDRAGRRRRDDGRDAGGVRAGVEAAGARRCARLQQPES